MFAVLFDLEGTLVQSIADYREFITKTKEKLVEQGIPIDELESLEKSSLMLNKGFEYVEEHFIEKEAKRFHFEIDTFLKSYELYWANQSRIFPDTLKVLRTLKHLKYKMGLITNTSKEATNHILSLHGIGTFFDIIVTREDVRRLKPDPEGVFLALKVLNERNFVFVGDLVQDSLAAKRAGGVSIILNRKRSKKLKFRADYVIRSLSEILDLIQNLEKNDP